MIRHFVRLNSTAILIFLAACAGQSGTTGTANSRTVLSSEEMQKAGFPDAFTTVQSLRPNWLQLRGTTSLRGTGQIKVYLDGSLMGGPEQLRQISTRSIATIQYFDGLEASERWGFDHGMGAIVVSTRRAPNN